MCIHKEKIKKYLYWDILKIIDDIVQHYKLKMISYSFNHVNILLFATED